MIYLKTPEEIEKMRAASVLVSQTLGEVARWIEPGVSTRKLDTIAREFILDNGGKPACLGYEGFPATLCIEVNETVVHGFPSDRVLVDGDIIGIDTVVEKDGFMGDTCYTLIEWYHKPRKDGALPHHARGTLCRNRGCKARSAHR